MVNWFGKKADLDGFHRILNRACDVTTDKMAKALDKVKWDMLSEWAVTKKAPQHARWVHDGTEPPEV